MSMFAPEFLPSALDPEDKHAGREDRLKFPGWSAQAGQANPHGEPFRISEIVVMPDDSYCFTVKRGGLTIVTFCFDTMEQSLSAARHLKPLLAVLPRLRMPVGQPGPPRR
jgi:hypothetical protein